MAYQHMIYWASFYLPTYLWYIMLSVYYKITFRKYQIHKFNGPFSGVVNMSSKNNSIVGRASNTPLVSFTEESDTQQKKKR